MTELDKLHQLELKIALEIVRICKQNGVRCFLIYGSLLGAVRHRGFIPWDDDLDIAMPREDYVRFIRVFQQQTNSEVYFLENWDTEPEFGLSFSKVKLNNTIFEEYSIKNTKTHKGISVDVFPLDLLPNDPKCIRKTAKRLLWLGKMYKFRLNYLPTDPENKNQYYVSKMIGLLSRCIPQKMLRRWIEKEEQRYDNDPAAEMTTFLSGAYNCRDIYNKNLIEEIINHEFEEEMLPIPAQYDAILSKIYGNYMTLPPAEKQVLRHNAERIEFGPFE